MKFSVYQSAIFMSLVVGLAGCATTTPSHSRPAMLHAKSLVVPTVAKPQMRMCMISDRVVAIEPDGERSYL